MGRWWGSCCVGGSMSSTLHVVECVRRGWWGVGDEMYDKMYKCTEWPPRVVDGAVEGGCERLAEYARKVEVSLDVWHGLPCLRGTDIGATRTG